MIQNLEKIARVNWPTDSKVYKVVQIYVEGEPYLRFGDPEKKNHATILESFLRDELKLEYKTKKVGFETIPVEKGEIYELCGAGYSKVDFSIRTIIFNGKSMYYGIGINQEHINKIKELEENSLDGYHIIIK